MPQNTLVVTPGKMAAFYSHHKLELEAFPFTGLLTLFRSLERQCLTVRKKYFAAARAYRPLDWQSCINSWDVNITSSRPNPKPGLLCQV
jgi:hypothetical protein